MTFDGAIHPYKLASLLLQYPTGALFEGTGELEAAVSAVRPRRIADKLARFVTWLREAGALRAAQHYVETFDTRRRCALYLTYHRHGDTRRRGVAMLAFKATYRAEGLCPTDEELPDYLPMVLEFAAASTRGEGLLTDHRAELELLLRGLREVESPYADVVDAVCARLPALGRGERSLVRALWESGPPSEEVGIEPFAPPEYLRDPTLVTKIGRR